MRGDLGDAVRVEPSKLAVDLQERGEHIVRGRRRHVQLGRVREDFRNDPLQKRVVEHDAAAPEGLLEDVVDKRRGRLIARLIPREHRHRRLQILIVQQRKEGDVKRRIGGGESGTARRIPGVLHVSHAHARHGVRRRRPVEDQLRSAVVDVVVGRRHRDAGRLQINLNIFARGAGERVQVEERGAARGHDDAGGAGTKRRDTLGAEGARHAQPVGVDLGDRSGSWRVERKQGRGLAVLFDRHDEARHTRARRADRDLERPFLAGHAVRLVDRDRRRRAASRCDVDRAADHRRENDERHQPSEHGLP